MDKLQKTGHHGFPVVDEQEKFQGIVTLSDVESLMAKGSIEGVTVADIATKSIIVAYPDQHLHSVLVKLGPSEVGRIPVVDRDAPKKLLGILRRSDIIRAYTKAIARKRI